MRPTVVRILALVAVLFAAIVYAAIFARQAGGLLGGDLSLHLAYAEQLAAEPLAYPLFHHAVLAWASLTSLDLGDSSVVVLTLSVVLSGVLLFLVLRERLAGLYTWPAIALVTVALCFVAAVDLPGFCATKYVCYGSPNSVHNPTIIVAKPFALLALLLVHRLVIRGPGPSIPLALLTTVVLVVGALAKPNFALALIVSAPLFLWLNRRTLDEPRDRWIAGSPIIGLIAVMAFQYILTYQSGTAATDDTRIVLDVFGVARLWSPSPIVSMLLLTAFPIGTLVMYPALLRDRLFSLTLMTFMVALAQYWFLAEQGSRYPHGNFGWGVEAVLPLLFALCVGEVLKRLRTEPSPLGRLKVGLLVLVFLAHLGSGLLYVKQLLTTSNYL